ncbi:hypothetical protein BKA83DRAFT_3364107 [Pisolithus microcarpus]|nr:hypothetical protein BKA83DRAFT_3364107 [Pisolithus microcarpus]
MFDVFHSMCLSLCRLPCVYGSVLDYSTRSRTRSRVVLYTPPRNVPIVLANHYILGSVNGIKCDTTHGDSQNCVPPAKSIGGLHLSDRTRDGPESTRTTTTTFVAIRHGFRLLRDSVFHELVASSYLYCTSMFSTYST